VRKKYEHPYGAWGHTDTGGPSDREHAEDAEAGRSDHGAVANLYVGNIVYGGVDGVITTFAVVSGVVGAALDVSVLLILGVANLLADGFSMAVSAYLSSKSEQEYYQRQEKRQEWKVQHKPDVERDILRNLYEEDGYDAEESHEMTDIQTRQAPRWVRTMMIQELGLVPDRRTPPRSALVTFGAFVLAGSLPLLVYMLGLFLSIPDAVALPISIGLSGIALFALGAAKVYVTRRNWFHSGLETMLIGALAGGVAYAVGFLLERIVP